MAMKMAVVSMEMPSGGNSPSRRRAGTETSVPRIMVSRWRRLWNFSRIVAYVSRVFATDSLSRRKGSLGGALVGPHNRGARPTPWPRRPGVWGPLAPLWSLSGVLEASWKNKVLGVDFVQF